MKVCHRHVLCDQCDGHEGPCGRAMNGPFYQQPEPAPYYLRFHDAQWREHVISRTPRPVMMSRYENEPRTFTPSLLGEKGYTLAIHYAEPGVQSGVAFSFEFRKADTRDAVWNWLAPAEDVCQ